MDHGTYISFDDGGEWHYLASLPNVATYDMVVHPRDLELVIGTHGRSIYVMDVKPLHTISERLDEAITAIEPNDVRYSARWGQQSVAYRDPFMPNVQLMFYLSADKEQGVEVEVSDANGKKVTAFEIDGHYGFNVYNWNLMLAEAKGDQAPEFMQKGEYTLTFKANKAQHAVPFTIK